jgi:TolB protein
VLLAALVAAGCGSKSASSPDMAFVSTRDGDYAIYGMAADGGDERRLTKEKGDPATPPGLFFQIEPAWSPDGTKIAFVSSRDGRSHIYVMAADGSGTTQLTSGKREDSGPTWSPDGRRIAFARDKLLFITRADGGAAQRVTTTIGNEETEPAWSPDGRWLAYVRRKSGFTAHEIWRVRPDGGDPQGVTRLDANSNGPAWSPDGRRIAFSSDNVLDTPVIYAIALGGKAPRVVTGAATTGAYEPSWSPDGKTIAFWSDGSIYTVPLGGDPKAITSDQNNSSPAWRPVQPKSSGY